jgi:CBS domain-containing protein
MGQTGICPPSDTITSPGIRSAIHPDSDGKLVGIVTRRDLLAKPVRG